MRVAESTLLEGKMIHLNEQTEAFGPETLHILGGAMDEAWRRVWPDRASGTLSVSLKAR